ncbi:hypothetical protein Dip510_001285 [Elusimicrobium posterum]|uniref:permease n=1 Tax=Elusimicrobium posterum TaxID=3116653 RepID=UPI003C78F4DD
MEYITHALSDFFALLIGLTGIAPEGKIGLTLTYFFVDTIKIFFLLFFMISFIGVLRTYVSKEAMEKYLGSKNKFVSSFFAAMFAIFTPFCSCSSIPIFISLVRMRVPFSATICFLAVSPLVNEYLVGILPSYFGFKIAGAYVIGGIAVGMLGGWVLEKLKMEKHIVSEMAGADVDMQNFSSFKERFKFGIAEGTDIVKKLWIWILISVAIGAGIKNYVPDELILKVMNIGGIFSVPLISLIGVPLYANCAAVVPMAIVFFSKTVPIGTTIAFLMSMSALSLPEAVLLRKVMDIKLIAAFFLMVYLGIVILGYFLNFVGPYLM